MVKTFFDGFNRIRGVFSKNPIAFQFDNEFIKNLRADRYKLGQIFDDFNGGKDVSQQLNGVSKAVAAYLGSINAGQASIQGFTVLQKQSAIAAMAQSKSLIGARTIIGEFSNGCVNAGMSQSEFIAGIEMGNKRLANYLKNLNGAKGSLLGYVKHVVASEAANLGLELSVIALNAAISMGLSAAISLAIKLISKWIVTSEELAEKADEVTSVYKSQQEELRGTKKALDDLLPKYEKLSKGVDDLGQNVALSAEEYKEYGEVTNQIADLFPTMIQGYNDQGIAILECKDDVESLTRAYEENVVAANNAVLASDNAVFKNFKNKQESFDYKSMGLDTDERDALNDILNSEDIDSAISQHATKLLGIAEVLRKDGFEQILTWDKSETNAEFVKRVIQEDRSLVKQIIAEFDQSIETETSKVRSLAEAYLTNALLSKNADGSKVYGQISDVSANIIKSITGNLDYAFFKQFDDEHEMYAVLRNLLNDFNNLSSKGQNDLEVYLGMRTKLNNGECTIDEYLAAASNARSVISAFNEDEQKLLTLSIGLDDQEIDNQYQKILKHLQSRGMEAQAAQEWISGLEKKDFDKVFSFAVEFDRDRMEYELEQFEKGGNVDLHVRPVIDSSELEKAGWDNVKEGIATVYSGTYSNEDETVFANFTPIIVDENGDFKGILSPTALQEYAEGVLNGTRIDSDKLQIGATFEGEDAVKQAEKAGERISAIHAQWFVDSENFNLDEYFEIVEEWNRSIGGAAPAQFESFVSGEEFQSGIEGHLETAKELLDLLEKVKSGEKIEIAELNDVSPSLVGVENLEEAINNLISEDYSKLSDYLEKQAEGISWESEEESEKWYAYRDALLSTYEVAEQSKPVFGSLDEAMSGVGDATELMTAVYSEMANKGKLSLETVQALEKQFGTDARHIYSFVDGKPVADFDAIQKYYLKGITDLKLDEEIQQYLIDAYTIDPSKLDFSKAHEALKKAIEVKDLAADTKEFDASDVSAFMEFFGTDYEKYLIKNDLGEYIGANLDALREYAVGLLGDSEAVQKMFSENWDKMVADATEAKRQIDNALDKMDVASKVSAYLDNVGSGNFDYSDALKDAGELLKEMGEGYSLDDFFTENEDGSVTKHTQFLIDWFDEYIDKAVEAGEFTADTGEKIKQMAKQSNALKKLTTAMSKVTSAADLMKSAQKEAADTGRNSIDTLIALYNEFGEEASSMINIDADGGILVNTDAIKKKMYGVIDALVDVEPEIKQAMKNALEFELDEEEFYAAVDQYVSDVRTLSDTLDSLRKGEEIDMYSLLKDFPELRGHTENLAEAILWLIDSMNTNVVGEFGKQFGRIDSAEDRAELEAFKEVVLAVGQTVGSTHFVIDIDAEVDSMQSLFDAMKESVSSTGLTAEAIDDLKNRFGKLKGGFDPAELFEKTANGIHLNTAALRKLENAYEKQKKQEIDADLDRLVKEYNSLTEQIEGAGNAANTIDLYAKRDDILSQITETSELAAQYAGLTSAFYKWEQAQSIGEEGDMYDSLAGGLKDIGKLYEEGLVGTNKFRTAVQLMSNEDLSGASVETLMKVYKEGYPKMQKYFTDSNKGVLTFLNDLKKLNSEWVTLNKDGSWDINFGVGNDQEIADALGINVEAVQAIMRKLSDYGFDINLDSVYSDLDTMQTKAEQAAKKLKDIGKTKVDFNFKATNIERIDEQIAEARKTLDSFTRADGTVNVKAEGYEEAQYVLYTLLRQKQELSTPTILKLDINNIDGAVGSTLRKLDQIKKNYDNLQLQVQTDVNADTSAIEAEINAVKDSFTDEELAILAKLGIDPESSVEELNTQLAEIKPEMLVNVGVDEETVEQLTKQLNETDAEVTLGVNDKEVKEYKVTPKTGKVYYYAESSVQLKNWSPPMKTGTVVYNAVMSKFNNPPTMKAAEGSVGVDGTANPKGAAFAYGTKLRGDWGVKTSGMALGGELGMEVLVRDGKYYTIGATGAEFFEHKPGDIIFNAAQSKELLEKGKITNAAPRGKAFSSGSGSITANGTVITKPSSSSSSSSSKSDDKDDEKEPKTIDWIEIAIDRIERAIEHLASTASSTYRTLKKRLGATASEIEKVNDELRLQERAYDRYIQQANSVALSEGLKARIRDGAIDINEYDADTAELISEYQEWYEKAIDCKTAIDELHESLSSLYEEEFGMIATDFDNQLSLLEHDMATLENSLEAIELKGHLGGASLYEEMQAISYQQMKDGQKKVRELTESMNKAVQSGAIDVGSEAWYEMLATINETKEQIQESNLAMIEYGNSIRELEWNNFDYLLDRISQITEETEFLIDLLSDEKLHDERGNLTDEGMAVVGMYGVNYNTYLAQAKKYADEIKEVEKDLSKDPYDSALIERREELLGLQRDAISAAEDEKKAIADLVEEGFDIELEALKELIDKYKDSLSSAKDLYSYQKKVGEQSSEIAKLQKQLSAYSGDASEENRARIQKLQVNLEEAQDKLEESQYDQYIKDQTELLDDIYADYEEVLNERLDNVDALIADMIESVNVNSDDIASTIIQAGKDVGYYLTDGMKSILTGDGSMLAMYSKNFSSELTTLNDTVGRIQSYVAAMIGAGDKIAADTQIGTVQGFSDGGYVAELKKIAMRNGDDIVTVNTLKRGEAIFTPNDADLVARLIDKVPVMHSMLDTAKYMGSTASTPTQMNQNISQQFGDLHIEIDHVEDYNDLVTKMRDDPKFEKFIQSMTTDRLVGKSKLGKYKF